MSGKYFICKYCEFLKCIWLNMHKLISSWFYFNVTAITRITALQLAEKGQRYIFAGNFLFTSTQGSLWGVLTARKILCSKSKLEEGVKLLVTTRWYSPNYPSFLYQCIESDASRPGEFCHKRVRQQIYIFWISK